MSSPRATRGETSGSLSRRELVRRLSLLMGGALSAPVVTGLLAGCRAPIGSGAPAGGLTPDGMRTAGALAERILPRTDTPGALDAGVDRFIDAMLAGYFRDEDRTAYLAGLDRLERRARERWGASFADCSSAEQDELVAELDLVTFADGAGVADVPGLEDADRRFFRLHKELTVSGYYTSEVGQTQELQPMPLGEYLGDVPIGPDEKAFS